MSRWESIASLRGPRGEAGAKGDRGPKGDAGASYDGPTILVVDALPANPDSGTIYFVKGS